MSRQVLDGNKSFFKSGQDKNYMTREHGRVASSVITRAVGAAMIVNDYESGSTFLLGANTGAASIKLPLPESGLSYRFIASADFVAGNVTIKSAAYDASRTVQNTPFVGVCLQGDAAASSVTGSTSMVITGANFEKGDYFDLVCDGTTWFVSGMFNTASAVTIS
mgnify:CR=1 FL=1|tara:strand:+ start:22 stop:513 length:492 start_codon:yes stop_codon:yes gene_type:complete